MIFLVYCISYLENTSMWNEDMMKPDNDVLGRTCMGWHQGFLFNTEDRVVKERPGKPKITKLEVTSFVLLLTAICEAHWKSSPVSPRRVARVCYCHLHAVSWLWYCSYCLFWIKQFYTNCAFLQTFEEPPHDITVLHYKVVERISYYAKFSTFLPTNGTSSISSEDYGVNQIPTHIIHSWTQNLYNEWEKGVQRKKKNFFACITLKR